MTYELHPLCTLFPRITGTEFSSLVEDIKSNGLRQPIVLHQGMILDGGNRYRACIEGGIAPVFTEFDGGNIVSFVLSANLHRRHLSAGQQAAIVASAQDWAQAQTHGGNRRPDQGATLHLETVKGRASESGASERTQKMADKVARNDPDLAKKVAHGEISLPKAVQQIEGKPRRQLHQAESAPTEADNAEEARHAIEELAAENERLSDRLAVEAMDASEEEKTAASQTIAELRERVRILEIEVSALKASRDTYMRESSEKQKQISYWRKLAEKAAA